MRILVINCGSTTLKYKLFEVQESGLRVVASASIPMEEPGQGTVAGVLAALPFAPDAIAHRVVHGGGRFTTAVRVDDDIVRALNELTPLAPLHNGPALRAIELTVPWAFRSLPPSIRLSSAISRLGPAGTRCPSSLGCSAMDSTGGPTDS